LTRIRESSLFEFRSSDQQLMSVTSRYFTSCSNTRRCHQVDVRAKPKPFNCNTLVSFHLSLSKVIAELAVATMGINISFNHLPAFWRSRGDFTSKASTLESRKPGCLMTLAFLLEGKPKARPLLSCLAFLQLSRQCRPQHAPSIAFGLPR